MPDKRFPVSVSYPLFSMIIIRKAVNTFIRQREPAGIRLNRISDIGNVKYRGINHAIRKKSMNNIIYFFSIPLFTKKTPVIVIPIARMDFSLMVSCSSSHPKKTATMGFT